jgi:type VI protein secretion system component VasK
MALGKAPNLHTRLTQEFEFLFFGLAEARLDFLRRENDLAKTPNVYEFPGEFANCGITWSASCSMSGVPAS